MSYHEWRRRHLAPYCPPNQWNTRFWAQIDHVWSPEEQSELARLWKAWAPGD